MKDIRRYKLFYGLVISAAIAVSGCGLIPKEEVLPDAPIQKEVRVEKYNMVEVLRGDVINAVTVDCSYKAFNTMKYNFSINGLQITNVAVEQGAPVKAGDIMAELHMRDLVERKAEWEESIKVVKMKKEQTRELRDFAITTRNQMSALEEVSEQTLQRYEKEIEDYDKTIAGLEDNLYILEKRIDQSEEDMNNRRLIAGFDGVVSYVYTFGEWERSNKDVNVITLFDPETMVFVTDGKNSELFTPGLVVEVESGDSNYQAKVLSEDELSEMEGVEQSGREVYLRVIDENNPLQNGDRGRIRFTLDERIGVLYLPSQAIFEDDGRYIVYVQDEGGFKSEKEIEIGLKATGRVEIISGLNEGDSVILN